MARILILVLGFWLAGCSNDEPGPILPQADQTTLRTLQQGQLIGFRDETGAQVWKGVPFAEPPVGDLRWRAPRVPGPWEGQLEALQSSDRCSQVTSMLDSGIGLEPGNLVGSEDCLYLDIYAPSGAQPGDDLPVMMWIHGGGNIWGYADQYDGSSLAENENVIVVVIQYRLGPLGFFAHTALREEAREEVDRAANFALLDAIGALGWINQNIDVFGGNPANVTIFGESAGGSNVAGLLVAPQAEGLFHKAIIQSGWPITVPLLQAEFGGPGVVNPSAEAAPEFARIPTDESMRAASVESIYQAYLSDTGWAIDAPTLIGDGVTIPETGIYEAIAAGEFNDVPVMTGSNRDEMRFFNMLNPQYSRTWFGAIIRIRDWDQFEAVSGYQSLVWRMRAVDQIAEAFERAGHEEVWTYRFDWDEAGSAMFMDFSRMMGAGHSVEIPFVFNDFEFFGRLDPILFNNRNEVPRQLLADHMGAYWSEFARTGNPGDGGERLTDWRAWGDASWMMRLDTVEDGGPEMIAGSYDMNDLIADMQADPRLSEEDLLCEVVAAITASDRQTGARLDEYFGCS